MRILPALSFIVLAMACAPDRRPVHTPPKTAVEAPRPSGASYINGEVLGVDNVPAGDQAQMTLRLMVEPGADEPVQVRLGPGWFFTERGIKFEMHEPVQVAGTHSHSEDGKEVIIAHELKKGGMTYRRDPDDQRGKWQESPAGEQSAPENAQGSTPNSEEDTAAAPSEQDTSAPEPTP